MTRQNPAWHHPLYAPTPVGGAIAIVPNNPTGPDQFPGERPRIRKRIDAAFG